MLKKRTYRKHRKSEREQRKEFGDNIRVEVFGTQKERAVVHNTGGSHFFNPATSLGKAISDALDPTKAPSKPRTFAEMSESERAEMRRLYEKK